MTEQDAIANARLDERMKNLETKVDHLTTQLTELLALKHKGLGAFWLVSLIATIIFTAAISGISGWLRG